MAFYPEDYDYAGAQAQAAQMAQDIGGSAADYLPSGYVRGSMQTQQQGFQALGLPSGIPVDIIMKGGQALIQYLTGKGINLPDWIPAAAGLVAGALPNMDLGIKGPGVFDIGVTGPGVFSSSLPGVAGKGTPIKTWWTGTTRFYRTNLGWIAAMRKDGTVKWYKPKRPIVLSSNPNIGTLVRAEKKLSRWANSVYRVTNRKIKFTGKGRKN